MIAAREHLRFPLKVLRPQQVGRLGDTPMTPTEVQEGSIVWGHEARRLTGAIGPAMFLPGNVVFTLARLKEIVTRMESLPKTTPHPDCGCRCHEGHETFCDRVGGIVLCCEGAAGLR